jgi:ABC-2 type transport system ATP-binding protein
VEEGNLRLYGANGAGKSTTIKILTGMLSITSGNAVINGYNVIEHPEKVKRFIGYVPGSGDLFLSLTPLDFLQFVCKMYDIDRSTSRKRINIFLKCSTEK